MISDHGNTAEVRREAAQADLDARRSSTERNRLGQFATPNALALRYRSLSFSPSQATRSARSALPIHPIGTGSFYSAALTVFGKEQIESAVGVEARSCLLRGCSRTMG